MNDAAKKKKRGTKQMGLKPDSEQRRPDFSRESHNIHIFKVRPHVLFLFFYFRCFVAFVCTETLVYIERSSSSLNKNENAVISEPSE